MATKDKKISDNVLTKNTGKWVNRVCIGTPTLGTVRMEWVNARFGQTIPTNWSHVDLQQWMSAHIPIHYQVPDAENIIAKTVVEQNFEWLLFIEDDNIIPPNAFIKMNQYMIKGDVPVVGGLYFTKSVPAEPILYREKGKGYYADFKMGEKVWVSGLPFGFTLIHGDIIRALWKESPEYTVGGITTRRVFDAPAETFHAPETGGRLGPHGTSDLRFCERLMHEGFLAKGGFPEYQNKPHPFLVDTSIFVKHIDPHGNQYPLELPQDFVEGRKTFKEVLS